MLCAVTGWLWTGRTLHHLWCQLTCGCGLRAGGLVQECVQWGPVVLAGVSSRRGVQEPSPEALHVVQSTWVELPAELSRGRGSGNNGAHLLLQSWRPPQSPQLSQSPTFSMKSLSLLCRSCSILLRLSLRKNCPQCRCTSIVFLGEVSSESSNATVSHLPC